MKQRDRLGIHRDCAAFPEFHVVCRRCYVQQRTGCQFAEPYCQYRKGEIKNCVLLCQEVKSKIWNQGAVFINVLPTLNPQAVPSSTKIPRSPHSKETPGKGYVGEVFKWNIEKARLKITEMEHLYDQKGIARNQVLVFHHQTPNLFSLKHRHQESISY